MKMLGKNLLISSLICVEYANLCILVSSIYIIILVSDKTFLELSVLDKIGLNL